MILLTAQGSVETAVEALKLGAADYLTKPVDTQKLKLLLSSIAELNAQKRENEALRRQLRDKGSFGRIVGNSSKMRKIYQVIEQSAPTPASVLIIGESGTGKELVAQTLHEHSARASGPYLAVNCGAVSPNLIESEIFGHEKGSFTGADRQHQGFFELASGGTLFLDEITEMPLDLQVKLLRVLESGTFMRVGSSTVLETDVRMVAATNRNPMQAVAQGKLREDLLYRLNVFPIHLPALRERGEDVPLIAAHFLDQISQREGNAKRFSPEAMVQLSQHHWPGNVRELRNVVYRAYVMATESTIHDPCLPGAEPEARPAVPVSAGGVPMITVRIGTPLAEIDRQVTLATLDHLGRHKEKTAATLGISLKTLYNRLKEYANNGGDPVTEPAPLEEKG
ncbi:MAG: sigma-54-dependent transcriptional regulator [Rhizobacter sp.]